MDEIFENLLPRGCGQSSNYRGMWMCAETENDHDQNEKPVTCSVANHGRPRRSTTTDDLFIPERIYWIFQFTLARMRSHG